MKTTFRTSVNSINIFLECTMHLEVDKTKLTLSNDRRFNNSAI